MKKRIGGWVILAAVLIIGGISADTNIMAKTLNCSGQSAVSVSENLIIADKKQGEEMYSELLDAYYSGYQGFMDGSMSHEDEQAFYAANDVFEPYDLHGTSSEGEAYHRDLGYAFFDLNNDQTPELLIRSYPGDGKSAFYGFDAVFTIKDGVPVLLDNSWYRDQLFLLENGFITHENGGGTSVYIIDVLELRGDELVTIASGNTEEAGSKIELVWDEKYLEGYLDTDGSYFKLYYYLPDFYPISAYPYSGTESENEPQQNQGDERSQQNKEADEPFKSALNTIELTDFLSENIEEVKKKFPDMHDVGASDATEYANDYLILSAPYNDIPIEFINLRNGGTGASILGIELGMKFKDAEDGIRNLIVRREDWSANISYYDLFGGSALRLDYDDSGQITAIAIWADSGEKARSIQELYSGQS